jgi:exopolyphosphatase/guanosine-5'-triphosphate,3'-diphosphate pyrophosphatase
VVRTLVSVAAIDIGSNSVRLLVIGSDGSELTRNTVVTALATGLERTGAFDPLAYDATVDVIKRFASTIAKHDVQWVRAVATSASRDAHNGPALMAEIGLVLGVEPTIIDGTREARLAFAGATGGMESSGTKLVIDVGGGSTEFVYGEDAPSYAVSVDIGSVRLTDRWFDGGLATEEQLRQARLQTDAVFSSVEVCGSPAIPIGIAGTFTSLSAIALRLDTYDAEAVDGSTLDISVVSSLVEWLSKLSVPETALIPSLDPSRARVILGGAIAVERALMHCGIDTVTISDRGLLEGLAFEGSTP